MARLIPKTDPQDISNVGERDVAIALVEQLPDSCVVYHSYPWLRADRNDYNGRVTLREGEADFVIVHPKAGLLVLEVKGGEIQYDHENRRWHRREPNRLVEIKDPFEQARRNLHKLEQEIRRESFARQDRIPCPYGYAVAFPHCEYSGGVPPGAHACMVFSASDLPHLGNRVATLLGHWNPRSQPVELTKEQMNGIQLALSPAFKLLPVLFRQIREQEAALHRLTEVQLRLLDFLSGRSRAAVKGVAGSGKTILATSQAQRFARHGKKTLFVCFNKSLADWLNQNNPEELGDTLKISHFHGLCAELCRKARIPFSPKWDDKGEFWRTTAPDLLLQALETIPDRFDAIVVDEGQDFHDDWWIALEMLNAAGEDGPFYVFYDPAQNLFVSENLAIPDLGRPFELPTNCRNTRMIAQTCGKIRGIEISVHPDAPSGGPTEIRVIPQAESRAKAVSEQIAAWIDRGRLNPSQVAILSPLGKSKSCLSATNKAGKTSICDDINEWRANQGVLFATIRSFKGLEADAIIVTDVSNPASAPYFSDADFYVACSRARHVLVIFANEEPFKE